MRKFHLPPPHVPRSLPPQLNQKWSEKGVGLLSPSPTGIRCKLKKYPKNAKKSALYEKIPPPFSSSTFQPKVAEKGEVMLSPPPPQG